MRSLILAAVGLFAVLPACAMSSSSDGSANSSADDTTGATVTSGTGGNADEAQAMTAAPDDSCTATLHFLQKDAYKDGAGRSSDLWPPHTTVRQSST